MQQRRLGSSPVFVSEIGLGTWGMSGAFWGAADDAESIRVIRRALELGVTLIDTAEAYGQGHAEEVVGKALVGRRQRAVIATKVAPNHLAPGELEGALDGSMKRLQTDYRRRLLRPLAQPGLSDRTHDGSAGAASRAADGSARSASRTSGLEEMDQARSHGTIDVLQPPYNMLWREVEAAILPYCRKHTVGVMPYSGLAQGLLTGALSRNTVFAEGDERRTTVLFQPGVYERALDAVDALRPIAKKYDKTVPQLAVQWLTSRPGVSAPLLGARTVREIEDNAGSVGWSISPDDVVAIDRLPSPIWAEIAGKGDMFGYWAHYGKPKVRQES